MTMATTHKHKKNLIVSYKNLSGDLKELFNEAYPEGHSDYITKFVKPNGEAIYVVPFETEDTAYMVKFDMKVDTLGEDLDKALFDDDGDLESGGKDDEFAPLSEALDKEEETVSHREQHLRHGDFEDVLSNEEKKQAAAMGVDKEGLKEAFDGMDDAEEAENVYDESEEDDDVDDFEPSDDDLRGIEDEFRDAENPPLDTVIAEAEAKVEKAMSAPAKTAAKPKAQPKKATVASKAAAPKSSTAKPTSGKNASGKSVPSKNTSACKNSASKSATSKKK